LDYVRKFIPNAEAIIAKKSLDNKMDGSKYLSATARKMGYEPLLGFQLKYIYCIDKKLWNNYSYIPFSKIKEIGAGMYKGKRQEHEINAV